jgi:hypothetical protein
MAKIVYIDECYADEFDVQGFIAMSDEEYYKRLEQIKKNLVNKRFPIEVFFGTNEWIDFETKEEYINVIENGTKEITDEQLKVLMELFGDGETASFGETLYFMEKYTDDYDQDDYDNYEESDEEE